MICIYAEKEGNEVRFTDHNRYLSIPPETLCEAISKYWRGSENIRYHLNYEDDRVELIDSATGEFRMSWRFEGLDMTRMQLFSGRMTELLDELMDECDLSLL